MVIAHIIYYFFELEKPQRPISLENSCKMADAGACLALFCVLMMVIAHIIYYFFELEKPQRPISLENSCKMADAGACLALFCVF